MSALLKPLFRRQIVGVPVVNTFDPLTLFDEGQQGAWYDPSDLTTLYQDAAGITPVTADGDPVGLMLDKSGNGHNGSQATSAARPIYRTDGTFHWLAVDKVDDNLDIPLPDGIYTVLQGTMDGLVEYTINVTGGAGWQLHTDPRYMPGTTVTGLIITDSAVPDSAREYIKSLCSGQNLSAATSMQQWFRGRSDITEINTTGWDTSGVTSFEQFAFLASNLTNIDVSQWDTSVNEQFMRTFHGCSALTHLDVSNWDTSSVIRFRSFAESSGLTNVTVFGGSGSPFSDSPCINYTDAFINTNLTQQSIDDILVAINAANTSNGTFGQSGGAAPSATGEAAIDALRLRGWTITVTGGY